MSIQVQYLEISQDRFEEITGDTSILEQALEDLDSEESCEIVKSYTDFDYRLIYAAHYLLTGTPGVLGWSDYRTSPEVIGERPENLLIHGGDVIVSTTVEVGYNPLTPVKPDPLGWGFGMPRFLTPDDVKCFAKAIGENDFSSYFSKNNNPPPNLKKEICSIDEDELESTFSELREFFGNIQDGNYVIIAMT